MFEEKVLLTLSLVAVTAVLSAILYGLAILWAVDGRRGWLWRISPLALLLAALVPIGAYDLLVLFGTQTAVVLGSRAFTRFNRSRGARKAKTVSQITEPVPSAKEAATQFTLRDVLKGVLLAGALFAIARLAP